VSTGPEISGLIMLLCLSAQSDSDHTVEYRVTIMRRIMGHPGNNLLSDAIHIKEN